MAELRCLDFIREIVMPLIFTKLACTTFVILLSTAAFAGEPGPTDDLARQQLSRVIAVLRLQTEAAGQSCLDALHEVHKTEDQLKTLQSRTANSDLALAQDVLETDYESGKEICGADAARVCVDPGTNAALVAACKGLHQTGSAH